MKILFRIGFLGIALIISFSSIISCASVPRFDPNLPAVEILRASASDIKQFGVKQGENPYLEPSTLLRGKINEFLILKIRLNISARSHISIVAQSMQENGSEAGRFYAAKEFSDFWDLREMYSEDENPYGNTKQITIQRSCLPALDFYQDPGIIEYYFPLVGPNPIPRPAKIYVQVTTSTGESAVFNYLLE